MQTNIFQVEQLLFTNVWSDSSERPKKPHTSMDEILLKDDSRWVDHSTRSDSPNQPTSHVRESVNWHSRLLAVFEPCLVFHRVLACSLWALPCVSSTHGQYWNTSKTNFQRSGRNCGLEERSCWFKLLRTSQSISWFYCLLGNSLFHRKIVSFCVGQIPY